MCIRDRSFPVDGVVVEGSSAVDESALTGESLPVDKEPGDKVAAASLNKSGSFIFEASRVGAVSYTHLDVYKRQPFWLETAGRDLLPASTSEDGRWRAKCCSTVGAEYLFGK